MKDMVKANRLGMKTNGGWYDYPQEIMEEATHAIRVLKD